ncbi:MAG: ATP-binding protein [Armatimonadota bacterium]|jgi:tRNA 2-thiocytidine biosynthesis protein TtcA
MSKRWRTESERLACYLGKKLNEALRDHDMIQPHDRVLVGVSGGKDSLSLLRLLKRQQQIGEIKFELMAAHIKGDARGSNIEPPDALVDWLDKEGVPYAATDLILPDGEPLPMDCERCGRNRRRSLFEVAEAHGCNKVALGHHLEDFSHTALLNLFASGRLETMAHKRKYFGGRFTVIRPLAYIKEASITRFAKACGFPVIENNCPVANQTKRKVVAELLSQISHEFRSANKNILKAAGLIGDEGD